MNFHSPEDAENTSNREGGGGTERLSKGGRRYERKEGIFSPNKAEEDLSRETSQPRDLGVRMLLEEEGRKK